LDISYGELLYIIVINYASVFYTFFGFIYGIGLKRRIIVGFQCVVKELYFGGVFIYTTADKHQGTVMNNTKGSRDGAQGVQKKIKINN